MVVLKLHYTTLHYTTLRKSTQRNTATSQDSTHARTRAIFVRPQPNTLVR